MSEKATLFIFYTYDNNFHGKFDIDDLPTGWWWVGAGRTYQLSTNPEENKNIKKPKYEREEQFSGPEETKNDTIRILHKALKNAKQHGILKCYKIEDSYEPYGRGIRVE